MKKTIYNPNTAAVRGNYELQRLTHPITSVNADSSEADLYNSSVAYGAAENDYLSKLNDNSTVIDKMASGFDSAVSIGSEVGESVAGELSGDNKTAKTVGQNIGKLIGGIVSPALSLANVVLPKNVFSDQFHSFMSSARSAEKDSAYYDAISANEDKDKAISQYNATLDLYGKEYDKEQKQGIAGEATRAIHEAKTNFDSTINDLNAKISNSIAAGNQKFEDQKYWENKGISDRFKIKQQGNIDLTDPDTYIYRLPGLMGSSAAGLKWQVANMAGTAVASASIGAMYGSAGAVPGAVAGALGGAAVGIAGLIGSRENESGMEAFGGYRDKVNNLLDKTKGISKDYVANTVKAQLRRSNPNNFNIDALSQDELIDLAISGSVQVPNKQFGDILSKARHGISYVYDSNNTLATADLLEFGAMITPFGKLLTEARPLANAIGKVSQIASKLKLDKAANFIENRGYIQKYLGDRIDDVANWAINKTTKDLGAAVAKKGIFDKVTGIAAKGAFVTLSEGSEEGVQDMIRDDFQNNKTSDGSNYLSMWLKNTGRAVRSTFAALTPWDSVYSSDKDVINDYKGGALLGGIMTAVGLSARNIHNISHPMAQYNTDKLLGTLFADHTAIKDGINKGDTYANIGKNNDSQRLNQAFDDLKSIKPDYITDDLIDNEREKALKIAGYANSSVNKDLANSIGIAPESKEYDRYISLLNHYETANKESGNVQNEKYNALNAALLSNENLNKLITDASDRTNTDRQKLADAVKLKLVHDHLGEQSDLSSKISDLQKKYKEDYDISTNAEGMSKYKELADKLKEDLLSSGKKVDITDSMLSSVSQLSNVAKSDQKTFDALTEYTSALVQHKFDEDTYNIFVPKFSINKSEDNSSKFTLSYNKEQNDEIKNRVNRSLKVSEEDDKTYNDNSVPNDLKVAVDEEKAATEAVNKANVQAQPSMQQTEPTVIPAPVPTVEKDVKQPVLKPTEEIKESVGTVNQLPQEKPVESLKTASTAKSEKIYTPEEISNRKNSISDTLKSFADTNIAFDEENHEYTNLVNPNQKLSSVSVVKKDTDYAFTGNVSDAIRDRAANNGKRIHSALENIAKGNYDEEFSPSIDKKAHTLLSSILNDYDVVSAEQVLGSLNNNIAGTTDLLLIHKKTGKLLIVDYKTEEAKVGKEPFYRKYYDRNLKGKTTFDGYFFQLEMYKRMLTEIVNNSNTGIKLSNKDVDTAILPISYFMLNDDIHGITSPNKDNILVKPTKEQEADVNIAVDNAFKKMSGVPDHTTDVQQFDSIPVTDDGMISADDIKEFLAKESTEQLPSSPENTTSETIEVPDIYNASEQEAGGEVEVPVLPNANEPLETNESELDLSSEGGNDLSHLLNHIGLRNNGEISYLTGFGPEEGYSSSLELDKALCTQDFIENCNMHFEVKEYEGKPAIYCVMEYAGTAKPFIGKKYVTTVFDKDSYIRNINRINATKASEDKIDLNKGLANLERFRNKIITLSKQGYIVVPNNKIIVTNGKFNVTKTYNNKFRSRRLRYNLITNNKVNGKVLGRVVGFGIPTDKNILDIDKDTVPNLGIAHFDHEREEYVIKYPGLKTIISAKQTPIAGGVFLRVSGRADQNQWLPGGYKNSLNIPVYGGFFNRPQAEFLLDLMINDPHSIEFKDGVPLVRGTNIQASELLSFMVNSDKFTSIKSNTTIISYLIAMIRGKDALAEQLKRKIIFRTPTKLYVGESPYLFDKETNKTVFDPDAGVLISQLSSREDRIKMVDKIYNNLEWNTDKNVLIHTEKLSKTLPLFDKIAEWFIKNKDAKALNFGGTVHGKNALTFKREHFINNEGKQISPLGWLMLNSCLTTDISPVSNEDIKNGISTSIVREPFIYVKDVVAVKPNEQIIEQQQKDTIADKPITVPKKKLSKRYSSLIDEVVEASEEASVHSEQKITESNKKINIESAKAWLSNKLGINEGTDLDIVKDTSLGLSKSGLHVMGACKVDCITLSTLANEGTEYHEAWHRVSNLLISQKSRDNIYNRFRKINHKVELSDSNIDEAYAEQFRSFMLNSGSKIDYDTKNWFKRIVNFIKTWSKVSNYNLAKIYYQINTGKYANSQVSESNVNRFKEIYGNAGAPFVLNGHKFKFIPTTKTFNDIVNKLLNIVLSNAPTLDSVDSVDFSDVEETLKQLAHSNKIDTRYKDMYLEVYVNFKDVFLPELIKKLKSYSIIATQEDIEAEEQSIADSEEDNGKSLVSDYVDLSYERSKMKSISAQMRLILSSVEKYSKQTDKNGNVKFVKIHDQITGFTEVRDYRETFNKLINNLHSVTNASELISALKDHAQTDSFYDDVLRRLMYASTKDKYIYDKLVVLLNCHKHDFVTIEWNSGDDGFTYSIINNTVDKKSLMYPRIWSSFFMTNSGLVDFNESGEPVLAKDNNTYILQKVYNEFKSFVSNKTEADASDNVVNTEKTALVKLLQKLGVTVDENSLNKYIYNNFDVNKDILADQPYCLNLLKEEILSNLLPRLNSVLQHSAVNKDLSTINISNTESIPINKIFSRSNFILNLAKAYASTVIDNSESMALGTDNKKLYQMANDSFATTRTDELTNNTDNILDSLANTPYSGKINSQESLDCKYTGPCKNASLLLDYLQNKTNDTKLSLETFINFKENSIYGNDNDYFGITDAEDYIIKLVATSNDRIVFPTIADKKTYFFLKGAKLFHNKTLFVDNKPVSYDTGALQRLRAYCFADLQSITECYKDLYSKESKLLDKDKIANYHTATSKMNIVDLRNNSKVTKKVSEPNGLRFRFLTELPIVDPKTSVESIVDLNDPDLTVDKRLKLAKEYFFDLSESEQLGVLQQMLANNIQKEINTCLNIGIITDEGYHADSGMIIYRNVSLPITELNRYGYTSNNIADQSNAIYSTIANNCINTMISVNETERVFTGDPAFYKQTFTKTIYKSGKSTTTCDRSTDKIKRLGGLISTGTNCLNVADRQDYTCTEIHVNEVGSTLKDVFTKWFINTGRREAIAKLLPDENIDLVLNNYDDYLLKYPELAEAIKKADEESESAADSYSKGQIDVTDGSSFISPNMYRDLMKMNGKFSDSTALSFKLLTEEGKITLTKAEEYTFIKDLYNSGYDITKFGYKYNEDADIDELQFEKTDNTPITFDNPADNILDNKPLYTFVRNTVLSPLKFVAYGTRFNNGLAIPNFDKFALFPLFKSLVSDTTIENLYNRMVKADETTGIKPIDMVMMDTAVKVGSNGVTDFYKKFDNDTNTGTINDLDKLNVYTQKFKYLRHQLETNPHEKSTEAVGTQMMKQCLSNVDENELYGKENDKITGKDLINNVFGAINKLSNLSLQKIVDKLYNGSDINKEELYSMILKDAIGSYANNNIISALTNGDTLASLSDLSFVESKIISYINKKTIDVNLPGGAFIQRPPLGMDKYFVAKKDVRNKYILNNGNRLNDVNPDGSLNCCISITMFKDVIPGYKSKSFAECRAYLINHNLIGENAEPLAIGYRIPTQAAASVSVLKVMDILPDNMGDTIILPEFFTKITGSDFDIDKLYVLRYNIDKDGTVSKYDNYNLENNTNSTSVENFLIHNYMRVLLTNNKQGELKNSIDRSTKLLKDTLAEIEEDNEKEVEGFANEYTPSFQLKKKHDYTSGKTGIGPMALQSVHHILTQTTGLVIRNAGVYDIGRNNFISYNKYEPLSKKYDAKYTNDAQQNRILDWFSGLINAFVDIAKDPYITKMNVNGYTYDAASYLLRLGLGKRALYFINNPIIKDLAIMWNNVSGSLNKSSVSSWSENNAVIIDSILTKYSNDYTNDRQMYKQLSITSTEEFRIECAKAVLNPYLESLDTHTLKDVKEDILNTYDYYDFPDFEVNHLSKPLTILFAWSAINKSAKDLSELIKISKIDTKKAGNTISQQHMYLLSKNKLEDNAKSNSNSFLYEDKGGLSNFFNTTFINTKVANSVLFIRDLFSKQLITDNEEFLRYTDDFINNMPNGALSNTDAFKSISSSTLAAMKSDFFNDSFIYSDGTSGISGKTKLFFGEGKSRKGSMARRLAKIKSDIRSGVIPNMLSSDDRCLNDLLEMLEPYIEVNNPSVPDFIKFSMSLDSDSTSDNNLINNFQDLLEYDNPSAKESINVEIRNFAHDLIAYAFYTSGDNANYNYIFKYVPHNEKKNIGFVKYMEDQLLNLNSGIPIKTNPNEIYKNNWFNSKLVNNYKFFGVGVSRIGERFDSISSYKGAHYLINDNGCVYPFMFVSNKKNMKNPYVIVSSKRVHNAPSVKNLYKLVGYAKLADSKEHRPVYQITSKLGYKSGGFNVVEYGQNTMFDQNKVYIPDYLNKPSLLDLSNKNYDSFIKLVSLCGISNKLFSNFYNEELDPSKSTVQEDDTNIVKNGYTVDINKDENSSLSSLYERPFNVKTTHGNVKRFHNVLQYVTFNQLVYLYNAYSKLNDKANMETVTKLANEVLNTTNINTISEISKSISKMPTAWVQNRLPQVIKQGITDSYLQNPSDINSLIATGNNMFNFTDDPNPNNQIAYSKAISEFRQEMIKNKREGNIQYMSNENSAKNRVITKQVNNIQSENTQEREQQIYTNHSGGANGADSYWQNIGEKYGVKTNAYYSGEKTPQGNIEISKEDYDEGRYEAAKAAKRNYGYNYSTMKNDLLIRDWSQVKHADSIFAISNIVGEGEKIFPDQKNDTRYAIAPSVTGGTGYAVGMAINHNKPIYVYNQGKIKNSYEQGWYRYDYSTKDFVKTEIPTLTNNFAGIGSRTLSQNDIKQIENVYNRTFSNNISSREQPDMNEWSKKEGWSTEYYKQKVLPKIKEAWQMEYKVADNQQAKGKFTGTMNFDYGNSKRSDVKSLSTIEAIKNGERTATTRYESDSHIDYWKKVKNGDMITWLKKDNTGKIVDKVNVIVTKELHKLYNVQDNNLFSREQQEQEGNDVKQHCKE